MMTSFRAFMSGLIDYAGLFPPARLDLDPAIRNYARYIRGGDAWMMNRFIIPAARLDELDPYVEELFGDGRAPLRLTVLGGGGALPSGAMSSFTERHADHAVIEIVETPLHADAQTEEGVADYLAEISGSLADAGLRGLELYAETRAETGIPESIAAIASFNGEGATGAVKRAGFKLRCGGIEPAAFPAVERVAAVIAACRDHGIRLKCTAGLHQPLRHFDSETGAVHHGFFNVFGAGVLAHALGLPEERLRACLAEEQRSAFAFNDDLFSWRDQQVEAGAIADARRELATGFGSCSFDEPRLELHKLGLL